MKRLSVDRKHSLAGRDTLDWFFANRKWIRLGQHSIIECAWAKRPLPEASPELREAGIRFLLLAPKRSYKRAHDRNKIKRWLRAAIAEVPEFSMLETGLTSRGEQVLVMMRIAKPIRDVKWGMIVSDIHTVAIEIMKRAGKPLP